MGKASILSQAVIWNYMESFEECGQRETREECGIEIKNVRFQFLMNLKDYAPKHYVHIGLIADWQSGEPQVLEPDLNESWGWYDLDDLSQPMFKAGWQGILSYKTGEIYFDN